ncbi:MAG TPA: helix-turn-helix domain-containing protein [Thermoanaerobaculia bacterium]|jgi:transcriptional regulator with XRE-family HTH domain|nr:helix-turn-helix domain-containing protein [Thermoanaerobaculia bacterium]
MSGTELHEQRLALGYSRNLLAEILQVEPEQLASWERGDASIDDDEDIRFALRALSRVKLGAATASGRS